MCGDKGDEQVTRLVRYELLEFTNTIDLYEKFNQ